MGANLLMLPILIFYLDANMLGLWYVYVSIGGIAVLFDFGFSVTFSRNITYCWSGANELKRENVYFVENKEPDYYLMKSVLIACKKIYLRISLFALILLLTIGTLYISCIAQEIEGNTYLFAWIIFTIAVFLNLYYGYYSSFLRGVGAISDANKNIVISRLSQIALTFLLLYLGLGIFGACLGYLTYGTVFRILGKHKFFRYQKIGDKLNAIEKSIEEKDIKKLIGVVWHNAWRDGLISISNYLSNQSTILICSAYLTLAETGIYSIGVQIAMAIASISGTLYLAYQPQLQAAYINSDTIKIQRTMSFVVISFILLFVSCSIFVSLFIVPLLRQLKPEAIVSIPVLLGLCACQFTIKFKDLYCSYFSCTNRIPYLKAFLLSSILCIILSVTFLGYFHFGIWGLITAQLVSQLIYNAWYWPRKAHREIGVGLYSMIKKGCVVLYNANNRLRI